MTTKYPKIVTDLNKLTTNAQNLINKLATHNLELTVVTKGISAHKEIMQVLAEIDGIHSFGDARIENIKSYPKTNKKKILIRIPMHAEVPDVIKYTDISFNSELSTLKKLDEEANRQNKTHEVVLMVDVGDLREGFFDKEELMQTVEATLALENLKLIGLATNLTCYGGVVPEKENLSVLTDFATEIKDRFKIDLPMISGGQSNTIHMLSELPEDITHLRIGEAIFLGMVTGFDFVHEALYKDVFKLKTQIIEKKKKPSVPVGTLTLDAFGNKPQFTDKGKRQRAIVAIGRQDIHLESLTPEDPKLSVIGASSDHLIVDVTDADYEVGDIVVFDIGYATMLQSFTSSYVTKEFFRS